jgi:hypothetical protein
MQQKWIHSQLEGLITMKSRDLGFVVVGLIVGLLVGVVLMGSAGLRDSLFGTAGFSAGVPPTYYLVDTAEARSWLGAAYPDQRAQVDTAFNDVAPLITTSNFAEVVRSAQPQIDLIVNSTYAALTGLIPATAAASLPPAPPSPLLTSLSDGNVAACLGLDENPYNVDGYALYLYIEIPSTQAQLVPETWERLDQPKDDDLFWQRLACQSLEQAQHSGGR